jgi:hypothetical protein
VAGPSATLCEEAIVAEDGRSESIDDVPSGGSFEEVEEPRTEGASIDSKPATAAEATVEGW